MLSWDTNLSFQYMQRKGGKTCEIMRRPHNNYCSIIYPCGTVYVDFVYFFIISNIYIYIYVTFYMTWIFHHFSTWKKPFIQFASSTSRSRSSSSITFRSWKCAKTASSDMRTRRHGKAETTRMTRMDVGWFWMMLDKTLASISSKEKSVGATSGLASIFNKLLHLKESEISPKRIYKTSNAGHFLGKLWWFEVPRNISMIFGRLLLANHVRVMLRVGATWGMEAKAAAGHQTRQALRTSRKNSEPGIRRLVDTLPVKVSKSRKSYQWLSIEVSIYQFHIQLMFFRPFGQGILRKPHSSPRHSSSAETFWDESRAMEFQLGTGWQESGRKMSWESLWIFMDLLIYPSTGWLASGGRNLRHKPPTTLALLRNDQETSQHCSVANITHLRNRLSDSLHQILQRLWILRSVNISRPRVPNKAAGTTELRINGRGLQAEVHTVYTPCAIRAAFFWDSHTEGQVWQISGAITSEPLVWAFPCPVQVLQHRDLQP